MSLIRYLLIRLVPYEWSYVFLIVFCWITIYSFHFSDQSYIGNISINRRRHGQYFNRSFNTYRHYCQIRYSESLVRLSVIVSYKYLLNHENCHASSRMRYQCFHRQSDNTWSCKFLKICLQLMIFSIKNYSVSSSYSRMSPFRIEIFNSYFFKKRNYLTSVLHIIGFSV